MVRPGRRGATGEGKGKVKGRGKASFRFPARVMEARGTILRLEKQAGNKKMMTSACHMLNLRYLRTFRGRVDARC